MGGMLASSEWIYWEALSLIIGTLGVVALSVHTIPTQVVTIFFMLPLSLGIALSIRLGSTLPVSVKLAKQVVWDCMVISLVVFGAISIAMYTERRHIFGIFTKSAEVLAGCEEIWAKVCMYNFVLGTFGVLMGACVGLGMQWTLGIAAIVVLWVFALPAAYVMAVLQGGGLNAAWMTIWPPYILINLILAVAVLSADWEDIATKIRIREGVELVKHKSPRNSGAQPLLGNSYGSVE
jgi:Na+-driven multidrug efflux pump